MTPSPKGSGSVPSSPSTASGSRRGTSAARQLVVSGNQDGWMMAVELVTATFTWGGIGYVLDRWVFHTEPILMSIGFFVGFFAGMYLLYLKTSIPVPADDAAPDAEGGAPNDAA